MKNFDEICFTKKEKEKDGNENENENIKFNSEQHNTKINFCYFFPFSVYILCFIDRKLKMMRVNIDLTFGNN